MCVLLSVCTFLTFWINSCQNHFQPLFVLQFFCVLFCWYLFSLRHHNPNLFNMLTQIYSEFLVHLIQLMLTGLQFRRHLYAKKINDNEKHSNRIAFNVNYFHLLANKEKKNSCAIEFIIFFVTTFDVIHTRLSTERLPDRVNWMHKFR